MLVPLTGADPFAVAYDGDDIIICGAVLDSEDPESADIMLARLGPNGAPRWVTIRALHRIATPCSRLAIIFAQLLHGARGPPRPPPPGQLELLA